MTIGRDDPLLKLAEWVWQLRREHSRRRVIEIVSERAQQAESDDYHFLAFELAGLLRDAGRIDEAIQIFDEVSDRFPDDVRALMSKSSTYFWALDQPEQALKCIDAALERARRTGFFRRKALGDKARILLELSRGDELSDVLEEIMLVPMMPGIPDVARERDFVDRAPPGLIRKNVLERYNEFRPWRPEDGLGDEPPKYEPANDWM